jgi:hypothetical protein
VNECVNPVVGFEVRGGEAHAGEPVARRQTLFLGATVDLQALVDVAWRDPTTTAGATVRTIGHTLFEYANVPLSTLRGLRTSRSGTYR